MCYYPKLICEISKRGIKKRAIAAAAGITTQTLQNKLKGRSAFTWPEICIINRIFFPDMEKDELFARQNKSVSDGEETTYDTEKLCEIH